MRVLRFELAFPALIAAALGLWRWAGVGAVAVAFFTVAFFILFGRVVLSVSWLLRDE